MAEFLLLSANMVDNIKFNTSSDNNKTVKKSSFFKKLLTRTTSYLTLNTKIAFTQLKKIFIKVLIFCYFDLKYYIWIKTNIFGYAH